jgi:catechol 2,3-dioxygenase-like lactoylglutathione lyase family enzyme
MLPVPCIAATADAFVAVNLINCAPVPERASCRGFQTHERWRRQLSFMGSSTLRAERRGGCERILHKFHKIDTHPLEGVHMIGYVTLGTQNLARAAAFYDALLSTIGASRYMESDRFIAWAVSPTTPSLAVALPFDGKPATVGNGTMVALVVDSRAKVDALHKKALELGATDEGPVGARGDGFYAGYFRDPDGNKLNAFCMG